MHGVQVKFLVDTGAAVTLVTKHVWNQGFAPLPNVQKWDARRLIGVNGTPLQICGCSTVELAIGTTSFHQQIIIVNDMTTEAILGLDFLEQHKCIIDTNTRMLHIQEGNISVPIVDRVCHEDNPVCRVLLSKAVIVPAKSKLDVIAEVASNTGGGTWMLQGASFSKTPLLVARELVTPFNSQVPVSLMNPGVEPVRVRKGTVIGTVERLEEFEVSCIQDIKEESQSVSSEKEELIQEMVHKLQLPEQESHQLLQVLRKHANVFASSRLDFGRTNHIQHHIPTGLARPIRQPVRRLPPARQEVVEKHVQEMLQQDVIQPSKSSWASPVVLVKKKVLKLVLTPQQVG